MKWWELHYCIGDCNICSHPCACIFRDDLWRIDKEISSLQVELACMSNIVGDGAMSVDRVLVKRKLSELRRKRRNVL